MRVLCDCRLSLRCTLSLSAKGLIKIVFLHCQTKSWPLQSDFEVASKVGTVGDMHIAQMSSASRLNG
jgi:hypothetical protein